MSTVRHLDVSTVLRIHREQIAVYGGADGLRDGGLLESAIAQPQASFGGEPLYNDLFEMAAAYLFHIVQNHPFVDGNKRAGLASALFFLAMNGITFETPMDALYTLTIAVASGQMDKDAIADRLRQLAAGG